MKRGLETEEELNTIPQKLTLRVEPGARLHLSNKPRGVCGKGGGDGKAHLG